MTSNVATIGDGTWTTGRRVNVAPAAVGSLVILFGALYLNASVSGRQALLFAVGVGAGVVLYHASFGFTSSWRAFVMDARGAGLRAQMLMLGLTCVAFFPVLGSGQVFGQAVRGSISPVGVSVVAGAFLFGIGMQLGGGCASGTLYSAGGGNTRMVITLLSFVAGSVLGAAHAPRWTAAPAYKPVSLIATFGPLPALALSIGLFSLIAAVSVLIERRRHGRLLDARASRPDPRWVLQGPWPLVAGAIGLAIVNIATLVLSGRPWGVTSAFALWGAKALEGLGVNVAAWPYWSAPAQAAALRSPLAADVTSVMDIGIMLGALIAACAAGRFAPAWRVAPGPAVAAVVGGLLLGYGARIAYGCNIGAYFSGIASGSLHGWVWMVAALTGTAVGSLLRPRFGLST